MDGFDRHKGRWKGPVGWEKGGGVSGSGDKATKRRQKEGGEMGADLYINSVIERARKRYDPKWKFWSAKCRELREKGRDGSAEHALALKKMHYYYRRLYPASGYFRDSYNDTSVLWIIGMSWWKLEYIDKKGVISVRDCRRFLEEVKNNKVPKLDWVEWVNGRKVEGKGEEWEKYFEGKRRRLMWFLGQAIKLNEPIKASV